MKVYQINYDLRKQRDYAPLFKRIKQYRWCHPLESCWVVVTTQSAAQIRDHLAQAMDKDDGLLVARLSGEAAWRYLQGQASSWLKQALEAQAA